MRYYFYPVVVYSQCLQYFSPMSTKLRGVRCFQLVAKIIIKQYFQFLILWRHSFNLCLQSLLWLSQSDRFAENFRLLVQFAVSNCVYPQGRYTCVDSSNFLPVDILKPFIKPQSTTVSFQPRLPEVINFKVEIGFNVLATSSWGMKSLHTTMGTILLLGSFS